jgi:hypothetical protein
MVQMKPTPAQQLMIKDGLPVALILSPQERKAIWDANPPKQLSRFVDPRIEQDRQLRAEQKAQATQKRIDALRQSKGLSPIYNPAINSNPAQENDNMPKFVIKPLDKHGAPVIRGMTSIKDDATQEQIDEKIVACVKRGGSKVAVVLLEGTDGKATHAWTVVEGAIASTDVAPYLIAEPTNVEAETTPAIEVESEEVVMAKKAKAKTAKKAGGTKKPRAKKEGVRAGSKTEIVAKLLKRDTGCTAKQVLEATGWPAVSMPAMAKNCGLKLRKEKEKGKPTRYFGE